MFTINIDENACCGDSLCAKDCPVGCLVMENNKVKVHNVLKKFCMGCGHCAAVCPKNAINIKEAPSIGVINRDILPSEEGLALLMQTRRSIRKYKENPVKREDLEKAINTARYAPTAKNTQKVEWLVVEGREKLHAVADIVTKTLMDMPGGKGMREMHEQGQDPIFRSAPGCIFTYTDVAYDFGMIDSCISITYLELALANMNIGTCWAGWAMTAAMLNPEVAKILGLPEDKKIQTALMVGYSSAKYLNIPGRNAPSIKWVK